VKLRSVVGVQEPNLSATGSRVGDRFRSYRFPLIPSPMGIGSYNASFSMFFLVEKLMRGA
jgi:hypothetical protein